MSPLINSHKTFNFSFADNESKKGNIYNEGKAKKIITVAKLRKNDGNIKVLKICL